MCTCTCAGYIDACACILYIDAHIGIQSVWYGGVKGPLFSPWCSPIVPVASLLPSPIQPDLLMREREREREKKEEKFDGKGK